jgi:hypothetical protein
MDHLAFGFSGGIVTQVPEHTMDGESRTRQLRIALQRYMYAVEQLPYPGSFNFAHAGFAELVANGFHVKQKTWLNPYELAAVCNYVALFGTTKKNNQRQFDMSKSLNGLKKLWALSEEECEYSDNPAYEATFILRFVYQQMPFSIHPRRVARTCSLMNALLSAPDVSVYVQEAFGVSGTALMAVSMMLLSAFRMRSMYTEPALLGLGYPAEMRVALGLLAANRTTRTAFHNTKLKTDSPTEKPYEINSLLRYPLIKFEADYYAPYPDLIGYACTRGLFFRFSEEGKDAFRKPFVAAMEIATAEMLRVALPGAVILTEEGERKLGWDGKTNDVTVILGDTALMIECKLSGLFVEAKRTAAPEAIIADVKRQIADGKTRRGLFQLHDKRVAVRAGALPPALMAKYKGVTRFFPVILLFDAIEYSNAGVTIGNIIKDELLANRVVDFEYQIWHLEELSWLTEYAGLALMDWVSEKFSPKFQAMGLVSFIFDKTGGKLAKPIMYMPQGDTQAYRILKRLSDGGL